MRSSIRRSRYTSVKLMSLRSDFLKEEGLFFFLPVRRYRTKPRCPIVSYFRSHFAFSRFRLHAEFEIN